MLVNTPGNTKTDFATENNFGCKHFIFKQQKKTAIRSRFVANQFVSGCHILKNLAFLTFKCHASSQNFVHSRLWDA
jgi:hypothetical protein